MVCAVNAQICVIRYYKEWEKKMNHNKERMVKELLNDLTAEGNYNEADKALREYLTCGGLYDDVLAIYDGDIGQNLGDSERVWVAIQNGLCRNPENYELYLMLGNYFEKLLLLARKDPKTCDLGSSPQGLRHPRRPKPGSSRNGSFRVH